MDNPTKNRTENERIALVVDASTPLLQVGVLGSNEWKSIETSKKQALEGLFAAAEKAIRQSKESFSNLERIFYCEGPGSTLGLRIAAAFVRSLQWAIQPQPRLDVYNALDLAKLFYRSASSIQAPFRKGFRFVRTGEDPIGQKDILETEEAKEKYPNSFHFPDPRNPEEDIEKDKKLEYSLTNKAVGFDDLAQISKVAEIATPYSPRPTEFKKWQP